ncbi:MAG TPA: hypothetical protein PKE51_11345 [Gemmatimonadaceae bacterium]|nr:hypothetical protein [Gemmatimonadaceae bacterium]
MFSTCCFCHAPLGANEAIEHFPVGRRLAFDGERGRLWAVCPRCARWNLAPIEERWEALEACEKAYRTAKQRVSTDNIALARLPQGTDLVRIGRPLLPEYAAWRYGDAVRDRRRRVVLEQSGALFCSALLAGILGTGFVTGASAALLSPILAPVLLASGGVAWWSRRRQQRPFTAALPRNDAASRRLAAHHLRARLGRDADGTWVLETSAGAWSWWRAPADAPSNLRLTGAAARAALPALLAAIDPWGGNAIDVGEASRAFERTPDVEALFDAVANSRWLGSDGYRGAVIMANRSARLALEMALHEDDERRALAGELGALYARWEEAERIARIADGMLTRLIATGAH